MLWSKPILERFVRSHRGNLVLISLRQFALTADFWQGGFLILYFLDMLTNPIICTKLNFCRITLLANVNYKNKLLYSPYETTSHKRPPVQNTEIFPLKSLQSEPLVNEHLS